MKGAKAYGVTLLLLVLFAWALYALMMAAAAQAHTLPMSEVQRGIKEAVKDQFYDKNIVIGLGQCHRINAHGGECVVRVLVPASGEKWCGIGWAKLIGTSDYMRAHGSLTPCPTPKGPPAGTKVPGGGHIPRDKKSLSA
jgi:hypothetical protein